MDDDFESQFADELDALDDFEPPEYVPPKFKRTLKFETPKNKQKLTDCDDEASNCVLTPLESPVNLTDSTCFKNKLTQNATPVSGKGRPEKRSRNNGYLSDEENQELPPLEPHPKRSKTNSKSADLAEDDFEVSPPPSPDPLVDKILNQRSKKPQHTTEGYHGHLMDDYDYERRRVHHRIPSGDFVSTTGTEGERVYLKLKDEYKLEKECEQVAKSRKMSRLLAVSIDELKEQIEQERQQKLLDEADRITAEINRDLNGDVSIEDVGEDDESPDLNSHLWVEKYAPRKYTDLLSEENINRTLLHWLKLWDYIVFGKELNIKNKDKKKQNKDNKKKKYQPEVMDELDKYNRPVQKIALLNGPPGLGKTTLAHVLAEHAGYNMVEINASDDRSADVFKNKLEAATQMKAVLGDDPRPNCLIIDEIDGAPLAAINVLINLIKRTDEPTGQKKKKQQGGMLLRPIICICNDQYVPALRQLRQCALIVNFPPTEPAKLAGRLYEVIRFEQLKADMNTLLALCEKTDNDIRSCLNTLQFIQRRKRELTLKSIQMSNVGSKDTNKSLFSLWYDVFSMPRQRRNRFVNIEQIRGEEWKLNNTTHTARFHNIVSATHASGDYEKVIQGLFENYLECKSKDPKLEGMTLASEWICFTDEMYQYINHMQDYCLMPYIPYVVATFHLLYASNQRPKVQYPHAQYEAFVKHTKSTNLVNSMMSEMLPSTRKYLNEQCAVLEVLPPLMDIIQPTLRPVNTQLYSNKEKEQLSQLISIMIAYNMTYHQEKTEEGQYTYVLDPNMDEVIRLPGMKHPRQLTYAAKQLIAREIQLEKMRRTESASGTIMQKPEPSHKQKLTAKPITKEEEKPIRDFFGRVIKKKTPEPKQKKVEKKNVLTTDIWFHFKEGYSNAVRRNVRVQDFL